MDPHTSSTSETTAYKRKKLGRPVLTEDECYEKYGKQDYEGKSFYEKTKIAITDMCICDTKKLKKAAYTVFPPSKWVPSYKPKKYLFDDIVSGLTIGIVQLPQGLAYGLLAAMPPIAGLYTSFWPVLAYALFGTSKHISYGTFAIVSLMTGTVINKNVIKSDFINCDSGATSTGMVTATTAASVTLDITASMASVIANATNSPENVVLSEACQAEYDSVRFEYAAALCICVCFIHLGMYIIRLGVLTSFLSSHLVSGFTCATGFHVITSQVPKLFGLTDMPDHNGFLAFFYNWIDIFNNLYRTNITTMIVSIICIFSLRICKEIQGKWGHHIPFPIPLELFVVIFADLASYLIGLGPNYGVDIVDNIPTGIPAPTVPNFSVLGNVFSGAIAISIVSYCVAMSLARKFGAGHGYKVNVNQELLAIGLANLTGSFFNCIPTGTSLSRTSIMNELGGKTQLVGIIASVVVLVILLWIGSLFEPLPTASLAAIIVVSLRKICGQFEQLPALWRTSKIDAMVWVFTWWAVIILDVDYGLYAGVGFSLLTVAIRIMIPRGDVLVKVNDEVGFKSSKLYNEIKPDNTFLAFKFPAPIIYPNIQRFTKQLNFALGFNLNIESLKMKLEKKRLKKIADKEAAAMDNSGFEQQDDDVEMGNQKVIEDKQQASSSSASSSSSGIGSNTSRNTAADDDEISITESSLYSDSETESEAEDEIRIANDFQPTQYLDSLKHLTFDMSSVPFIDSDGVLTLKSLLKDLKELDVMMSLSRCSLNVRRTLEGGEFPGYKKDDEGKVPPMFFRTVESANEYLKKKNIRRRAKQLNDTKEEEEEPEFERTEL